MSPSNVTTADIADRTSQWYEHYKREKCGREMMLWSPDVLVHRLAWDVSTLRALRAASRAAALDLKATRILDVGCANGASIVHFLHLGFTPDNLYGIDIRANEIADAKARYPAIHFTNGSAAEMPYDDGWFDVVCCRSFFIAIPDDELAAAIAREMVRVTRPGGAVLIQDWIYAPPGNRDFKGVTWKRIARLFDVGRATRYVTRYNGALVPPIGRPISRFLPSLYLLTARLLPFLVGQRSTLLLKA